MQGVTLRRAGRRIWRKRQLYFLLLPALVSVAIFHYIPIYGVQIAFKDFKSSRGIWGSPWVGLEHFVRFITYVDFWKIVRNTVMISLSSLLAFPCPILFALLINEIGNTAYKRTVQMISFAPHFISTVVVCSMTLLFLSRSNGVINNIIALFGGERRDFISDPALFAPIYVISGVWQNLGWDSIIYIAALSSVPVELYEAARIDGANRMGIVAHINIPMILPTAIILLILNTGSLLSVGSEKIYLLQNSLNLGVSRVISTYTYEIGLEGGQFSYSTAIGLFNNIVNILFILCVNAIARRVTQVGLW